MSHDVQERHDRLRRALAALLAMVRAGENVVEAMALKAVETVDTSTLDEDLKHATLMLRAYDTTMWFVYALTEYALSGTIRPWLVAAFAAHGMIDPDTGQPVDVRGLAAYCEGVMANTKDDSIIDELVTLLRCDAGQPNSKAKEGH